MSFFQKDRLETAADVLKAAGVSDVSRFLNDVALRSKTPSGLVELIDTYDALAICRFGEEDIENKLEEMGYCPCIENVDLVKANLSQSFLEKRMCEIGVAQIGEVIRVLDEKLLADMER